MTRNNLRTYICLTAAYEIAVLGWFQVREGGPPPLMLDPRGSIEWMFASTLAHHYFIFSTLSALWLATAGLTIRVSHKMLWVYGVVEGCLAVPTLLLFCAVMFLGAGHVQFRLQDAVVAGAVLLLFSLVPVFFAFRTAVAERAIHAQP
jgi:hypothetical protein